jgi:hypothetical protein
MSIELNPAWVSGSSIATARVIERFASSSPTSSSKRRLNKPVLPCISPLTERSLEIAEGFTLEGARL